MADHEKDVYFLKHIDSLLDSVEFEIRKRIKNELRRIYPIDYFSASFIDKIPIGKLDIEEIKQDVIDSINKKYF